LIPQPDSPARGVWNEESIRTLTAIFELQRVELHSELEEQRIDNNLVANVIDRLATTAYFPDPSAQNLPIDMEAHLRLLAVAIRVYKYNGRSLEQKLHENIYNGLTALWQIFESARSRRDDTYAIEDWNIAFLLKHCQSLLVSIDGSDSFGRKISRRAIVAFDTSMAGVSHNFRDLRPGLVEILKRQRSRPSWHDEYVRLEDACSGVFAGDIRIHGPPDIAVLVEEAVAAAYMLEESMDFHYQNRQQSGISDRFRHVIGWGTHVVSNSGPYEEHSDYLRFGILDLLSQLSVRIRTRSRRDCYTEVLRIVRLVLERSPKSSKLLHLKATDLWNRISDLGHKDGATYGDEDDRYAIHEWIIQTPRSVENPNTSTLYTLKPYIANRVLGGLKEFRNKFESSERKKKS